MVSVGSGVGPGFCSSLSGGVVFGGVEVFAKIAVSLNDFAEEFSAGFEDATFGFGVHAAEAETGFVAFGPFIIVHQGPSEIAADVVAIGHGAADLVDMVADVFDAFEFIEGADAIFDNDHGFLVAVADFGDDAIETGGVNFPAHLGVVDRHFAVSAEEETWNGGVLAVVVIDSDDVAEVEDLVEVIVILPLHGIVGRHGPILPEIFLPHGEGMDAHDERVGAFTFDDFGRDAEGLNGDFVGPGVAARVEQETGRPMSAQPTELDGAVGFVLGDKNADV